MIPIGVVTPRIGSTPSALSVVVIIASEAYINITIIIIRIEIEWVIEINIDIGRIIEIKSTIWNVESFYFK